MLSAIMLIFMTLLNLVLCFMSNKWEVLKAEEYLRKWWMKIGWLTMFQNLNLAKYSKILEKQTGYLTSFAFLKYLSMICILNYSEKVAPVKIICLKYLQFQSKKIKSRSSFHKVLPCQGASAPLGYFTMKKHFPQRKC